MVNHINIKILENDTNIKKMSTQYTMDAKNLKKKWIHKHNFNTY